MLKREDNIDIELIDFMDHVNFILSNEFVEKWRYKYSTKFLKHFQLKLMANLQKSKPLKKSTLYNYLVKRCKYSDNQVNNFFEAIDIDSLYPLVLISK